jgi:RNA-directed DNA polymerase
MGTDGGESEHLHCTEEAGEPSPTGPGGGKAGVGPSEPPEGKATGTWGPGSVYTRLRRIAALARRRPKKVLTTLAHHIDEVFLLEAYRRTRKGGAVGVDGETAQEFARELQPRLRQLENALKSGTYYAPPVRRQHIPKGDGSSTRPIGIPTFEDKVLQRAVAMVLEAVYEQDFHDFSYGFRPRRSAHQALQALWKTMMGMGGSWILDVDIKSFFDTIDHGHLRSFLDQRVRDGVLRRAIDKWLKAGVLEEGEVSHPDRAHRKAGSSRRCWPTSTCTRCSTNGSCRRSSRGCTGRGTWSASPTISSSSSNTKPTHSGS